MFTRASILIALSLLALAGCARPGAELHRRGDEIVVCGRYFHTQTPVVLWTDPGGYDAYRTEKRFVPWDKAAWTRPEKPNAELNSPNRLAIRFAPRPEKGETSPGPLTAEQFERVRGGGWDLDLLREHVDQFVLHYDVCGVSRQCFRVLHDFRGLSVHFMLDIDGTIYQTMDVKDKAWHATICNDRSVGVEIANMGAYAQNERSPLGDWYQQIDVTDAYGSTRTKAMITIPPRLGDGGLRVPGTYYSARTEPVVGEIHGRTLTQYDLTPQQYEALTRLTKTLNAVLPKIKLQYPKDAEGRLITKTLSPEELQQFQGVIGHFHIQENKVDPGPAMQWERVVGK